MRDAAGRTSSRRSTCPTRIIRCRSGTTSTQLTTMNRQCPRTCSDTVNHNNSYTNGKNSHPFCTPYDGYMIALDAKNRQRKHQIIGTRVRTRRKRSLAFADHRERQGVISFSSNESPRAAASPPTTLTNNKNIEIHQQAPTRTSASPSNTDEKTPGIRHHRRRPRHEDVSGDESSGAAAVRRELVFLRCGPTPSFTTGSATPACVVAVVPLQHQAAA